MKIFKFSVHAPGNGNAQRLSRGNVNFRKIRITVGHRNRKTFRMDGGRRVARPAIQNRFSDETSVNGRVRQIVIQQLGELHEHERISHVRSRRIGMHPRGNETRTRKRRTVHGFYPGASDAVPVFRRQQPRESSQRFPPSRIL